MNEVADLSVWIAFTAGIASFISPCVLPLVPSYITYISGLTFKQVEQAHPGFRIRLTVFYHSLAFIGGFSAIFITLGALAGLASSTFEQTLREGLVWVQRGGGLLVFLFGLHMAGLLPLGFLLGDKRVHLRTKPAGLFGTFIVGIAFAAGWTPCIGPILASILAMVAGSKGGVSSGVWLLAVYSAGLGLPFLIAGVLFHEFLGFFNRYRKYIRLGEILTSIMLMVIGLLLFFDLFGRLAGYLYKWFPWLG